MLVVSIHQRFIFLRVTMKCNINSVSVNLFHFVLYHRLLYKWSVHGLLVLKCHRNGPHHRTKFKLIDGFGDTNSVSSINFYRHNSQIFGEIQPSIFACFHIW